MFPLHNDGPNIKSACSVYWCSLVLSLIFKSIISSVVSVSHHHLWTLVKAKSFFFQFEEPSLCCTKKSTRLVQTALQYIFRSWFSTLQQETFLSKESKLTSYMEQCQRTCILSVPLSRQRTPLPATFLLSTIVFSEARRLMCFALSVASTCEQKRKVDAIKEARKGFFGCYSVCETMKDTKEG